LISEVIRAHEKSITFFEIELAWKDLRQCSIVGTERTIISKVISVGRANTCIVAGAEGPDEYNENDIVGKMVNEYADTNEESVSVKDARRMVVFK
jgi:hypothetical protein